MTRTPHGDHSSAARVDECVPENVAQPVGAGDRILLALDDGVVGVSG